MSDARPLSGLRVLSLESRRATEIAHLIRAQGAEPYVVPSVREVPIEENREAFAFGERLFRAEFDMVILLTGVGTRYLNQVLETRWPAGAFVEALRKLTVAARGPKPAAVMREWQVPVTITAPEPNTWRELLKALDSRPERRVAVQEYGRRSEELLAGLRDFGMDVTPVPIYQWALPEDTSALEDAIHKLVKGDFDVTLFTTAVQLDHLLLVAERLGLQDQMVAALRRSVVASIGPTTSEALAERGIPADFEPVHPKMGLMLNEFAQVGQRLAAQKPGR
jgi:uroporphyrinogen-III synthase